MGGGIEPEAGLAMGGALGGGASRLRVEPWCLGVELADGGGRDYSPPSPQLSAGSPPVVGVVTH